MVDWLAGSAIFPPLVATKYQVVRMYLGNTLQHLYTVHCALLEPYQQHRGSLISNNVLPTNRGLPRPRFPPRSHRRLRSSTPTLSCRRNIMTHMQCSSSHLKPHQKHVAQGANVRFAACFRKWPLSNRPQSGLSNGVIMYSVIYMVYLEDEANCCPLKGIHIVLGIYI